MKYIIDIEDEYTKDWVNESPMCKELCMPISVPNRQRTYHVGTGFKLEPYTEPDLNPLVDEAVETIENEVWNLAREIAYCMSLQECEDAGMVSEDDIYDDAAGVLEKLTYQEAKARYDAWKKSKDEIRVGDEVKYIKEYGKFVTVTVINSYGCCFNAIDSEGNVYHDMTTKNWVKTGRHFDVVDELLKKMQEKSE